MNARRVNAVWLQPIATTPSLLVNRERELAKLVGWLEEYREAGLRETHILVSGARGVGKSIFTRAAMQQFQKKHPQQCVSLTIDGRGLKYRAFLEKFAQGLADQVEQQAEGKKRDALISWMQQLRLLATNSQITKTQSESTGRSYGAEASVAANLFLKLGGKVSWQERKSASMTQEAMLSVTDDVLQLAINASLERLAEPGSPWMVVVFFDDLDQALPGDTEQEAVSLMRHVLNMKPCISIVHFRTEALVENIKREVSERLHLEPLSAEVLLQVVQRRLEAAAEPVQKQFGGNVDWAEFQPLAAVAGVPLYFLRWFHGLLRSQSWPPSEHWKQPEQLEAIVLEANPLNGADLEVVRRLVKRVDELDSGNLDRALSREALTSEGPAGVAMTEQEIEDLTQLNILLPKHRFLPAQGLCLEPGLALLRPSVQQKLR